MTKKETRNRQYLNVTIVTHSEGKDMPVNFKYKKRHDREKPMALDVLLQAQETKLPDLAFRYGCRARNCGVCTIDINGLPRIACRSVVRENDKLEAMSTLPVITDLVVRRDQISRQLRGKIYRNSGGNDLNVDASEDYHELTSCIECYACLHNCPMHQKNSIDPSESNESYEYGNPFSLLKLQTIVMDPVSSNSQKNDAISQAVNLGLDTCLNCPGCKCGIGIDLKGKVVDPLITASKKIADEQF